MTAILDEILADSRVATVRELREDRAARAREAQARHLRHTRSFVLSTSIAAISGALILYGAGGEPAPEAVTFSERLHEWLAVGWPRGVLFLVQVVALGVAAYAAYTLREVGGDGAWLEERRAAELGRIDLFDTIMAAAKSRGPEAEAEAFDHFLETQLAGQLQYYSSAEARHRSEASRTAMIGAAVAAIVAAAGATAGLSGVGGDLWIAIAAGVGVIAPILANAVRSWQEATLDREKAERYHDAWTTLTRLKAEAGDAKRALAAGDPAPAYDLIAQVHSVMRSENEAWKPAKSLM